MKFLILLAIGVAVLILLNQQYEPFISFRNELIHSSDPTPLEMMNLSKSYIESQIGCDSSIRLFENRGGTCK
jgi:hypothetical protein